ncbi:hypothetical protein HHK36_031209 [Tetracentron sinense]|uniref:Proline-rich protein 4 n=1 Tax=Tetracentron sinense TaxID=13715 RepID=A0A834YAV1_TETSI|nr:hypothetical protein HHK36_031209 [Tetracentron sinense]
MLRRRALLGFWLSVLLVAGFCHCDDKSVEVVGIGECADCEQTNIKTIHAFSGLRVAIDCKVADGKFKTIGVGELDSEGKFKVKLPREIAKENGELKEECYAQLHSASSTPCPTHSGLETSKIIFKSKDNGKHTFGPAGKLAFSPITCTSAFLWPFFKYPPKVLPQLPPKPYYPPKVFPQLPPKPYYPPKVFPPLPPKPYYPPIYKKPLPPPIPIYKKPLPPPIPIYKKPPIPIYKKPLPPPIPIYKKPLLPPIPVYKKPLLPPIPVYKKPPHIPIYKPKPPIYKKPPHIPIYKPKPPIYKKPWPPIPKLPSLPKIPPIYKKPHPPFPKLPPIPKKPFFHKKPLPHLPKFPPISKIPPKVFSPP